jgi:hypothetical protein
MKSKKSKPQPQPIDPSKPLTAGRHEQFAQHWAEGLPAAQAAVAAGYDQESAGRLQRRDDVQIRRAFLMGQRAHDAADKQCTREDCKRVLSQIILSPSTSALDTILAIEVYERTYGFAKSNAAHSPTLVEAIADHVATEG